MPQIAGFWCEIDHEGRDGPPLLMLHGSGQTEHVWSDVWQRVAPLHPLVRVRGRIVREQGFEFFRRNPDRSLDLVDLQRAADDLASLAVAISHRFQGRKPILAGYSNGAIAAASLVRQHPGLTEGAILFRPLLAPLNVKCAALEKYPVLILSGADDERRTPQDGQFLADHLFVLGAAVEYHLLPCGHGWDPEGRDLELAFRWLERICDQPSTEWVPDETPNP